MKKDNFLAIDKSEKSRGSPLHLACEFGRLEMVKSLVLEYDADINEICPLTGYTPLMYAC